MDVALGIIGRPRAALPRRADDGLRPARAPRVLELIRRLKREGTTILLTTHYLDEAAQLADRVAVIAAGKLRAIGAVDEIGGEEAREPIVRWIEDGAIGASSARADPFDFATSLAARLGGAPPASRSCGRASRTSISGWWPRHPSNRCRFGALVEEVTR